MSPDALFAFSGRVEVVAHRGFSARAPENTLAAVEAAIAAGADALEFDLQPAADGTPMVIHDQTLERTTNGRGRVDDHTPDALGRLDAGGWFDPSFEGEPVPRLEDVLATARGRVGRVYAEIKGHRGEGDLDRLVSVVQACGMSERTLYISMDWDALATVRAIDRSALLGYVVERANRTEDALARAIGDPRALLDFDKRILLGRPEMARGVVAAGVPLAAWTVKTVDDAEALVSLGCPRVTTNEVETMVTWKTSS